jgi:hypothetical protein
MAIKDAYMKKNVLGIRNKKNPLRKFRKGFFNNIEKLTRPQTVQ